MTDSTQDKLAREIKRLRVVVKDGQKKIAAYTRALAFLQDHERPALTPCTDEKKTPPAVMDAMQLQVLHWIAMDPGVSYSILEAKLDAGEAHKAVASLGSWMHQWIADDVIRELPGGCYAICAQDMNVRKVDPDLEGVTLEQALHKDAILILDWIQEEPGISSDDICSRLQHLPNSVGCGTFLCWASNWVRDGTLESTVGGGYRHTQHKG